MVHRGAPLDGNAQLVENTLPAFANAYEQGFRYFETDVHATRDGVLVACHDPSLRRVAGAKARIGDLDWKDIADIPVGGQPLPRLTDLLEVFPDVRFNVDPKSDTAVAPLVDLVQRRDVLDRVCIASFSDRRLRWVRAALGSRACTAAGPRELGTATYQALRGVRIDLPGVDVLQIPRPLTRSSRTGRTWRLDLAEAAQRGGLPVHVWTVNKEREMGYLLESGVDGVMSDDIDVLLRVFVAYGWCPST